MIKEAQSKVIDPVKLAKMCWPDINLYKQQREILYSLWDNYETFVPAGNELGKDFIAAIGALCFFISRRPAKVVTTSVHSGQLEDVLWGELRRLIDSSAIKLPIQYNHMKIRQVRTDGTLEPRSELVGRVVVKGESMLGRHIARGPNGEPRTLIIFDEASGCDDTTYETADTWTHRKLIIGNPYTCSNFFFKGVRSGDKESILPEDKLYRKVIKIKAEHSPNVRLGMSQERSGIKPTNEEIVPGVVRYYDYLQRRQEWDKIRQCIGLDAEFYEGSEVLLFPPEWLNHAEELHRQLGNTRRTALAIGVDPAEGGDNTCFAAVDDTGLIEVVSKKTPNTSVIMGETIAFAIRHGLQDWSNVVFDRGGGGKQHADYMRANGYPKVRAIGFGESVTPEPRSGLTTTIEHKEHKEERVVYVNRRAELYGRLRMRLDPNTDTKFAMNNLEVRRQMAPIPLWYNQKGQLEIPPKDVHDKDRYKDTSRQGVTLKSLIGHSPDELEAVALAVYGMEVPSDEVLVGTLF